MKKSSLFLLVTAVLLLLCSCSLLVPGNGGNNNNANVQNDVGPSGSPGQPDASDPIKDAQQNPTVQQDEIVKQHSNEDGDGYCDVCGMIPYIAHKSNGAGANGGICYNAKDDNSDSVCDTCGSSISEIAGCYGKQFFTIIENLTQNDAHSAHTDHNLDFVCDFCEEALGENYLNCYDADYNRYCDACGISYDDKCGDTGKYAYVLDRTIAYFEAILDESPEQNDALCVDDNHDGWCDMHTSPAHLVHGTESVPHWDENSDGYCDYCFIGE